MDEKNNNKLNEIVIHTYKDGSTLTAPIGGHVTSEELDRQANELMESVLSGKYAEWERDFLFKKGLPLVYLCKDDKNIVIAEHADGKFERFTHEEIQAQVEMKKKEIKKEKELK